jgi:hypothetical protein
MRLGRWVPEVLLKLWGERHPRQPLQLQLHFAVAIRAADDEIAHPSLGKGALTGVFLRPRGLLEATVVGRVESDRAAIGEAGTVGRLARTAGFFEGRERVE